jgi:hypothetical protein
MQSDRKIRPREFLKEDSARRTTIILEKGEREYIDALISDGKEQGIKPLISKMLDIHKNLMIYDWHFPGEYYCGISRIAFVNVELIHIIIRQIPTDKWREMGQTMGAALKVSMETTLDLNAITSENWASVFRRLKVQGLGDFYMKDKYLLVKMPFINESEVLAGILEGLLGVELDKKTNVPPLVFEVKSGLLGQSQNRAAKS